MHGYYACSRICITHNDFVFNYIFAGACHRGFLTWLCCSDVCAMLYYGSHIVSSPHQRLYKHFLTSTLPALKNAADMSATATASAIIIIVIVILFVVFIIIIIMQFCTLRRIRAEHYVAVYTDVEHLLPLLLVAKHSSASWSRGYVELAILELKDHRPLAKGRVERILGRWVSLSPSVAGR